MIQNLVVKGDIARFPDFPIPHVFSVMAAGHMARPFGNAVDVAENRSRILPALGVERMVKMNAEHGVHCAFVDRRDAGTAVSCDALVTADPTIALALFPADCLPVILAGEGFLALVHAGVYETNRGIMRKAAEIFLNELEVSPEHISVAIGPGIHRCCYRRDLVGENLSELLSCGIPKRSIALSAECTYCASDADGVPLFFSYHRAKKRGEIEGRFAALAALPGEFSRLD